MKCNLCGSEEFIDMNGRKAVRCKNCASFERTRLFWLYFERLKVNKKTKILHIAPEKGIYDRLSQIIPEENYTTADFDPKRYAFVSNCVNIDLTKLESWPSNHYDFILHMHVLEHIPCNIAYTLFHLHRMLKKTGTHLCIIPFSSGVYDESFDEIGNEERTRRFGQFDHVRKFGKDGIGLHVGKIINIPEKFNALDDFPEQVLLDANIPKSHWQGFHIGTVLSLKKQDYRLQ